MRTLIIFESLDCYMGQMVGDYLIIIKVAPLSRIIKLLYGPVEDCKVIN